MRGLILFISPSFQYRCSIYTIFGEQLNLLLSEAALKVKKNPAFSNKMFTSFS